jgi:hypothetical protein
VASKARILIPLVVALVLPFGPIRTETQGVSSVTTPLEALGANVGDDYFLATYTQLEDYWRTLDRESDRLRLVDIGRTTEGRQQWMAVITAPENFARLDRLQDVSRRLALAEGLTDDQARALAAEGRAVVWIDGGLHADEVLGSQQLIETVYQLVSASDEDTLRWLRDVIVLVVHANPDGHEMVSRWYMQEPDRFRRTLVGLPQLYHKYAGHDINRDFYLVSQAETINMSRVLYQQWFPQIVYDHHQTAPPGTVMFAPPFRDPFNYVLDPLIPAGIDLIAAAMHARFLTEGKGGVTRRNGANYSTWWNGGLRTTAYFHNQIGLLTETIGNPTPTEIPFVPTRQLPDGDLPMPVAPQRWQFRQSIEYSLTANRAVLDAASRHRELLLFNAYRMGKNGIQRGSEDTWTASPQQVSGAAGRSDGAAGTDAYRRALRDPAQRDPRGYILPADQPDFPTAAKFVTALIRSGVAVHRASAAFTVDGKTYPAGSFVVRPAQAFRAHVLDMFEPQRHPGPSPDPSGNGDGDPYDVVGWTLAFQMGVRFDRVLDAFEGPFERIDDAALDSGRVIDEPEAAGYLLSHHQNDSAVAVNRLLAAGESVYWLADRAAGGYGTGGAIYVAASPNARAILGTVARSTGLVATGVGQRPPGGAMRLRPVRVGLWDRYGGSPASGWTRWILERFEFPFELTYAPALDAGDLSLRYDVIVLPTDALPGGRGGDGPAEHQSKMGAISRDRTVPRLREFVAGGGTVIAIGGATWLGEALGLPVRRVPAEDSRAGPVRERFHVPGSILRMSVDPTQPVAYGFDRQVDTVFDNSVAFRLPAVPGAHGLTRLAWYDDAPLRSGWARGANQLAGAAAAVEARVGRGRVLLFGSEITFRAQPHGTFKFLFNGIHSSRAEQVPGDRPQRDSR